MCVSLITQDGDDKVPEWKQEYLKGTGYEVYRVPLTPAAEGNLYAEASDGTDGWAARVTRLRQRARALTAVGRGRPC